MRTAGAAAVSAAAAPEPAGTASAVAEAEPVTSPATTLAEDLESAGRLVGRGEYEVALEILDQAARANPADEALRKLVVEAEAAFIEKAYRHYLPASKVPVVHRSVSELASENLSSLDFFILSRVNGTWDVRSIVQITPTREVDALRALKRMRERGLIALRDPA